MIESNRHSRETPLLTLPTLGGFVRSPASSSGTEMISQAATSLNRGGSGETSPGSPTPISLRDITLENFATPLGRRVSEEGRDASLEDEKWSMKNCWDCMFNDPQNENHWRCCNLITAGSVFFSLICCCSE